MTRDSSLRIPRADMSKAHLSQEVSSDEVLTVSQNVSKKDLHEKYPLLHLSDGETSKITRKSSQNIPKLVGRQSVLNQVKEESDVKVRDGKDNATVGSLETNSTIKSISETLNEYRTRSKKLEANNKEMQKQIDTLYSENKLLRMSADRADQPGIDSYRQIQEDRKVLREAEADYKKRIAKLEKEVKDTKISSQNLADENKKLKEHSLKHSEKLENQSKYNNLYWKWNALKRENERLHTELETLKKFGSQSNVQIVFGRGLKHLDNTVDSKFNGKSKYNSMYEERNALKIENMKLKEENERLIRLIKEISLKRDEPEFQNAEQNLQSQRDKSDLTVYKRMYYESDKKAQLYKRIKELEHENTYLSLSNNNLLRELRNLQAKYSGE